MGEPARFTAQALWNRDRLALESDEVLAQSLDRGDLADWRELYRLAARPGPEGAELRRRIVHICRTVPLSFPHLFLAAMGGLGEKLDPYPEVPEPQDDIA